VHSLNERRVVLFQLVDVCQSGLSILLGFIEHYVEIGRVHREGVLEVFDGFLASLSKDSRDLVCDVHFLHDRQHTVLANERRVLELHQEVDRLEVEEA